MKILSIETSCDETGIALLDCQGGPGKPRFNILKEVLSSQVKIHAPFGGVVPGLAKREHIKNLPILLKKLLGFDYHIPPTTFHLPDAIAVTMGPGLEPALWTGIEFAKGLAKQWKKPLIGVNHMEGHLYSVFLGQKNTVSKGTSATRYALRTTHLFPAIALIVSGGHTILLRMDSMTSWKKLGETRDDAVGEAFDKAARLLNLPYPGGPQISKIALLGDPKAIDFPRPMLHAKDPSNPSRASYDFSFSGLKTAVLYYLKDQGYGHAGIESAVHDKPRTIPPGLAADIAASFECAAVDVLVKKTFRAVEEYGAKSVWLSGGVAANRLLRKELRKRSRKRGVAFLVGDKKHNTDNGAMIAAAAYMATFRRKKLPLVAKGDLEI